MSRLEPGAILRGRAADSEFAAGILESLGPSLSGSENRIDSQVPRPVAQVPLPFGRVEGDAAFILKDSADQRTLLIVEREASAPGNERNLLKWFECYKSGAEVSLRHGSVNVPPSASKTIVLLCFGIGSREWTRSDYLKTVAFSERLASLLNEQLKQSQVSFAIQSDQSGRQISDWRYFGRLQGSRFLDWLNQSGTEPASPI